MRKLAASRWGRLGLAAGAACVGVGLGILWVAFGRTPAEPSLEPLTVVRAATESAVELRAVDDPAAAPERIAEVVSTEQRLARFLESKPLPTPEQPRPYSSISGRVDLTGASASERASVRIVCSALDLAPVARGPWRRSGSQSPSADDAGLFRADQLAFGTWRVTASAPGFRTSTADVEISESDPQASVALTLARAWRLVARLADERTGRELGNGGAQPPGIEQLQPFACEIGGCAPRLGAPLPSDCRAVVFRGTRLDLDPQRAWYELALDTDGAAWIGALHAGRVVAVQLVTYGAPQVHLALDPESLARDAPAVRLVLRCRQGGAPIADAQVSLLQPFGNVRTGTSDANGEVAFLGLTTESPEVTVVAAGHLVATRRVTATRADAAPVELQLDLQRAVTGRLVGHDGAGIADTIRLVPLSGTARSHQESLQTQSAPDGTFAFPAVRPGEFLVVGSRLDDVTLARLRCDGLAMLTEAACADTLRASVHGVLLRRRVP